jgi:hypothetical protein
MSAALSAYEFGYVLGAQTAREKQAMLDAIGHSLAPAFKRLAVAAPKPTLMQKATQMVTGRAPATPMGTRLKQLAMDRVVKPAVTGLALLGGGHTMHNAMIQAPNLSHVTQVVNGVAQPSKTLVNGVQVLRGGAPVALNAGQKVQLARVGYQKPMWDLLPGITSQAKPFNYTAAAQQFAQSAAR